jgi:hypothetical protein
VTRFRWAVLPMVAAAVLASPLARADITKAQCIAANTDGQTARRDGNFTSAREKLRACSDVKCPALVRTDCTKRLDELQSVQPSIVFDAKDGTGTDVVAVKVTMDGLPFAEKLDGTSLELDPGEHVFVFEASGQPPVTQRIVVREGEKGRHEHVVVGPAAPPPAPVAPPPPAPTGLGTNRTVGLALAGAGVAGLAVGTVFGLLAGSSWNASQSECASPSNCPNRSQAVTDHDTTVTRATISTVGFIAGGALLAGGAVLFFTGGGFSFQPSTGVLVAPSVAPHAASLDVVGRF